METWTNPFFSELTNNVFTRWDANYPLSEFPPCAKFQDKEVDPVENRQTSSIMRHSFKISCPDSRKSFVT
jgi:hypothetical protein